MAHPGEYRDFSQLEDGSDLSAAIGADTEVATAASSQNFPAKLHYVLNELEKDGLSNIVGWAPHGRCFFVRQPQQFIELILTRWFCQTKYTSFQRQLNIYDFKRIASGPDKAGYYHEMFLRGKSFLAQHIPRNNIKGAGPRKSNHRASVPDFRSMPHLPGTNLVLQLPVGRVPAPLSILGYADDTAPLSDALGLVRNLASLRSLNHQTLAPSSFALCLNASPMHRQHHVPMSSPLPLGNVAPMNVAQALLLRCIADRQRQTIDRDLDEQQRQRSLLLAFLRNRER